NFWAMGDTGPCGPCSEILIDQGPEVGCRRPECKAGCDCDRYLELWNLVFMQFYRDESGEMTLLPKPSIDTGMGLERIAGVVQGVYSNYDSDLFAPIIERIGRIAGKSYGDDDRLDTAFRVIADHSRATAFLVADGVLSSNEGRGYVLRRVIRRAVRYGRTLGLFRPFMSDVAAEVINRMKEAWPHLEDVGKLLDKVVRNEEERFIETIDNGLAMLTKEIGRVKAASGDLSDNSGRIAGDFIFKLYDTYGFPVDIVRDMAMEAGLTIDEPGFNSAMEAQREQSRKSWKGAGLDEMSSGVQALVRAGEKTTFKGYSGLALCSTVSGIINDSGESITVCNQNDHVMIACHETVFYAESGGQIGDRGEIKTSSGRAVVQDTVSAAGGLVLHRAVVSQGSISCGDDVELVVAEPHRKSIERNHTGTHLLQAALRSVLGEHVKQSGSLVGPDRLRFDFTHFSPLSTEEIRRIENMINKKILENIPVETELLGREEAIKGGATALFGEKYDESVRVVSLGSYSRELCGGTHVRNSGEIGLLKILNETGIAAGIRRIEAITGQAAFVRFQNTVDALFGLSDMLKISQDDIGPKIEKLLSRQKELEKEVQRLTARLSLVDIDQEIEKGREVEGVKVVIRQVPLDSPKTLREVGDRVRDRIGTGIVVLGGEFNGKVALLAIVSKDLTKRFHAGNIVKEVAAKVGGRGGGRPDMAQAGGTMVDKLPEALDSVAGIIARQAKKI
ncbi:MAG: alanine--tRNA ligase, partial [Desulfobulbaceae bacterium]|nr:alanine--tRNA ligase [Desulfobulbaceae bacterium]